MAGKYSPTVSNSYAQDRKWWVTNGGGYGNGNNPDSDLDNDGFDSYGYSDAGPDRAGHQEHDYYNNDDLYSSVEGEWWRVFIPDGKWPVTPIQLATKIIDGVAGIDILPKDAQELINGLSDDPDVRGLLLKAYAYGIRAPR